MFFKLENSDLLFKFFDFLVGNRVLKKVLTDFRFFIFQLFVEFGDFHLEDFVFEIFIVQIVDSGVDFEKFFIFAHEEVFQSSCFIFINAF